MKTKSLFIEFTRYSFIFLFIYTGFAKIIDHDNFQSVISVSPLFSGAGSILSWTLPTVELLIGLLLFIPVLTRQSLYLSTGLMLIFTIYLIYLVSSGDRLPCRCGGVISQMNWTQHIFFNLFFCGIGAAALAVHKRPKDPKPPVFILDNYHR